MLHSKTMLIDNSMAIIGTANFDYRSFFLNYEVCVLAYGPELNHALETQFLADLQHAQRVYLKSETGLRRRLFNSVARLCSPLL